MLVFTFFLGAVAVGLLISHLAGRGISRRLDVRPGHARRVMPTLPLREHDEGAGAWRRAVRRVERAALPVIEADPIGVEAPALAAKLGEPLDVVVAVLERLREELPCRLRVTESGRLLHDFAPADLDSLAAKRRRRRPMLAALYLVSLFSNLGAAWPVITILFVASSTLVEVFAGEEEAVMIGIVGLASLAGLLAVTWIAGWLMHKALSPLGGGPRLGQSDMPEAPTERFESGWSWGAVYGGSSRSRSRRSSSSSSSSSSSGRGGGGEAIIIVVLIAIILACLFVLFVWARGIFRAIAARRWETGLLTPTDWVRIREDVDRFERYVPTNDLVGRIWRALRSSLMRRRPMDEDLGPRVLVRAARRGGWISALEIALTEGLDLGEAMEVGARLCTALDGRIRAVDGEVIFLFPASVLDHVRAAEAPDLRAEFLSFEPSGPSLRRKEDQSLDRIPVNLVGLRAGHLEAASRLATGAWLMAATGLVLFIMDVPPELDRYTLHIPTAMAEHQTTWGLALCFGLVIFAMATTALAAMARYATRTEAILGIRRDARRAAFQEIIELCADPERAVIDLADQSRRLAREFSWAWGALPESMLDQEMIGVAADLDLEPGDREGVWDLEALRARIRRVAAIDPGPIEAPIPEDDPVIYDTEVALDRITALL